MARRIFIGGSGRSGTTLLYRSIGCHSKIYTLPNSSESRFMIDQDGLRDLIDNLTVKFDNDKANEAVQRFEILMRVYLANPYDAPYLRRNIHDWFGKENLEEQLSEFLDQLILNRYQGTTLFNHGSKSRSKFNSLTRKANRLYHRLRFGQGSSIELPVILPDQYSVKFFDDRQELMGHSRKLVDSLFMNKARIENCETWCEKTPASLLNLPFIHELFPDSVFVHMKRDPRGIVSSMLTVQWSPSNVHDAAVMLKQTFRKWSHIKSNGLKRPDLLLELKLEDFVKEPDQLIDKVLNLAGLEKEQIDLPEMSYERISSWRAKLSQEDIQMINDILEDEILELGYEL